MSDLDATARRERFEAIYLENYHRILGYALRRVDAGDAADIVAETFLTAWRRLAEVPAGDETRLWLYGTARRVVANLERGRRRRHRLAARLVEQAPADPPAPDSSDVSASVLAILGPREREAITLSVWEGLSPQEIARVVGCSPGAARLRLHRTRRRLARELRSGRRPGSLPAGALRTEEML